MVADELPELATQTDPARHLDALPRRREADDSEQVELLRKHLFSNLYKREIIPDQDGKLCTAEEISYPPKELTPDGLDPAPFERWAAYSGRPSDWLHHKVLTRNRLATIDRLFPPRWSGDSPTAPRATIAEWLKALVENQEPDDVVRASMAAIQTAALIPSEIRSNNNLGDIVLTASSDWQSPDPDCLFLPEKTEWWRHREPGSICPPGTDVGRRHALGLEGARHQVAFARKQLQVHRAARPGG